MNQRQATRQTLGAFAYSFTGVDIEAFNPNKGAKFSPNLYAFLKSRKNSSLAKMARVFSDTENVKRIGFFDDTDTFIGARLSLVLCYGVKTQVTCPVNLGPLTEITNFWESYARDGRCAIDTSHASYFVNDHTRWHISGHFRDCLWCGKCSQVLQKSTTQIECQKWVTTPELAAVL